MSVQNQNRTHLVSHSLPVLLVGDFGNCFQGADIHLGGFGGRSIALVLEQISNQLELGGNRKNSGPNWARISQNTALVLVPTSLAFRMLICSS